MLLKEIYTGNKKIRAFLKFQCQRLAYVSKVDVDDILSRANEKLALQMHNGYEITDEEHLFKLVKIVANSSLQDIVRRKSHQTEQPTDPVLMPEPDGHAEQSYENRELLKVVDKAIRGHFADNRNVLIVYDHTMLEGHMSRETSEQFGININTVKTNMRMVRSFANKIRSQLN